MSLYIEPVEPTDEFAPADGFGPADELADDPFADDLTQRLQARAPRRYTNRATVVLAGLVLLVGGFVAGAQVQKHFGATTGTGTPTTFPTNFRGGLGGAGGNAAGGGGTGGTGGGGNATTGTVKLVDGSTVYVTTANGDIVIVHTNAGTTISQPGSLKDLTAGATVTVNGQTGSDGSVTATRISRTR
jgi:Domain of unknown function (DUF5666)